MGYLLHPSIPVDRPGLRIADVGTGTGYDIILYTSLTDQVSRLTTSWYTGRIWLLDLARQLPPSVRDSAHLEGLDISLAQTPPGEWLPANVEFRQFDLFASALPPDMVERYDIVHLRNMLLVVKDNDPRPALVNLLKMLSEPPTLLHAAHGAPLTLAEPTGHIQWGELDLSARQTLTTSPALPTHRLARFQQTIESLALTGAFSP